MPSNVEEFIADSVVKALGVAGVEAIILRNVMIAAWTPAARELAEEVIATCLNYATGEVRPELANNVLQSYRNRLTYDFVEETKPYVYEYAGEAWERGKEDVLEHALSNIFQKAQDSIISDLVSITGSSKENVQRTITRWFEETQGAYFDRFIVPETARILSYGEEGKRSLRQIGQDYKKFVEAEGYWSSVSEFNMESSKAFAQIQTLHELHISNYVIEAIIDNKTCPVCMHLHGTVWSVEQAVEKMYTMLIAEADAAYEMNPFPPRSTPKDYPDPQDSPYGIPPYHPRCRCNIRSEHKVTAMPREQLLAGPFDPAKPPSDKLLIGAFNNYVKQVDVDEIQALLNATVEGGLGGDAVKSGVARSLTAKEFKMVKEQFSQIPYELRKWASRNNTAFHVMAVSEDITSRVVGNTIQISVKHLDNPIVIQHELRHALINKQVLKARGIEELYEDARKFKLPTHVNYMFQTNGARGIRAMDAAVDELLAMVGDYYKPGMSLDQLVKKVTNKNLGISVGKGVAYTTARWSALEAKKVCEWWWEVMDVDDFLLLNKKQLLAKLAYTPNKAGFRTIADMNERRLTQMLISAGLDGNRIGDNAPFDVWIGASLDTLTSKKGPKYIIELKTVIQAKEDKITMRKSALARKKAMWADFKKKYKSEAFTVVFDERNGKYYLKSGVGSYRLNAMREVTEKELVEMFGGEFSGTVTEAARETARLKPMTSYIEANKASLAHFVGSEYESTIRDYTSSVDSFFDWNKVLRRSNTLAEAVRSERFGKEIAALYDAIDSAPKFSGPVFRGMKFRTRLEFDAFVDAVQESMDKSVDFLAKGFTSTSYDRRWALNYANLHDLPFKVMVQIETKSGVVVEALSKYAEEKEVLLNAFSRFSVISFQEEVVDHLKQTKMWVLRLREE